MHRIPHVSTSIQLWRNRLHNFLYLYVPTNYTWFYRHKRKFPSFSDSDVTFILYFINTNNIPEYILNPVMAKPLYDHHVSARTTITAIYQKLQNILQPPHPTPKYAQTSFRNSIPQNDVPTSVLSYININYLSHIFWIPHYFTHFLTWSPLTPHVKTIYFTAHASIITWVLACIFTFLFQKG